MLGLGIVAAAAQQSQQPADIVAAAAQSAVTVHGLILMAPGYVPDYPNPNPRTLTLALALTLAPTPTLPLTRYVPRYKPLPLFYLPARLLSWIQPQLDAGFEVVGVRVRGLGLRVACSKARTW